MNFLPLEVSMQAMYLPYWEACQEKTSDYTFLNIWAWAGFYGLEIAEYQNLIWIKDKDNNYRAPVGDWNNTDFTKLDFFNQNQIEKKLIRVPEKLKNILEEQFAHRILIEEDRDNSEYVYPQKALASLSGNKMQKKRNHFNAYQKSFGIDYRPFCAKTITDNFKKDLNDLQDCWCLWNDCLDDESLKAESVGIQAFIKQIDLFPEVRGGSLYVENNLVAFCIGEKLDENTFVVHFEKGHPDYRGAFQAINKCFAEDAAAEFEFINREQDSGNLGLRQAKETYHPSHFSNKFTITIKD